MAPVASPETRIIGLGSKRYLLASEADVRLLDTPIEGVESEQPFRISVASLAGGCNCRFAASSDVYAYTEDGDASQMFRFQRGIEITTYDLSGQHAAFASNVGHRGAGFQISPEQQPNLVTMPWFYLLTPRHLLLMNREDHGTSGTAGNAPTATTLKDTTKSWTTNEWVGAMVGSQGKWLKVTSNSGTVLTGSAGWFGKIWSVPPGGGKPYQVILTGPNAVHSDPYSPHSIASMGTHADGDGKAGAGDLGCGAFTGSYAVSTGIIKSVAPTERVPIVAFGREADECGALYQGSPWDSTKDGRVGARPVRMNWNDGSIDLYDDQTYRASLIWSFGNDCYWIANHYSGAAIGPLLAWSQDLGDPNDYAFVAGTNAAGIPWSRYFTAITLLGRILVLLDEEGIVTQIVRLKLMPVSQAPLSGGIDPQFGLGACRYEGGMLCPHRDGLFFLTEGEVGLWREVGLYSLNPGTALREAYPTAFSDPRAPYVLEGGGEIFMVYGNQLFVLNRNWYGALQRISLPFIRPERGGELETTVFGESSVPHWHTIAKLWGDTSEYAVAAGIQTWEGAVTRMWIASSARKVYRVDVRSPTGSHYPAPVATKTAMLRLPRLSGPTAVSSANKMWRRIRGWLDLTHANDRLKIEVAFDGGAWSEVTPAGGLGTDGPFSFTLNETGRWCEFKVTLTTGGTLRYPALILPLEIEGYPLAEREDVLTIGLLTMPAGEEPDGESFVQRARAEDIRGEISALRNTSQTLTFPSGRSWIVMILSCETIEAGRDTRVIVRMRRLS